MNRAAEGKEARGLSEFIRAVYTICERLGIARDPIDWQALALHLLWEARPELLEIVNRAVSDRNPPKKKGRPEGKGFSSHIPDEELVALVDDFVERGIVKTQLDACVTIAVLIDPSLKHTENAKKKGRSIDRKASVIRSQQRRGQARRNPQ